MRFVIILTLLGSLAAEDITTLDGKTYADVVIDKIMPEGVVVISKGRKQGIKFTDLPAGLAFKYHCEGAMRTAAGVKTTLKKSDAFTLADLEVAKKKAAEEGKPMGFLMVWDSYFGTPTGLTIAGDGAAALAHFHHVFKDQMVLVFVSHERELQQVPDAVKKGFNSPEEGGWAPNMAVVDPTATKFIVEIQAGDKAAGLGIQDLAGREKYFRAGIEKIVAAQDLWAKAPEPAASEPKSGKKKAAK